MRSFGTTARRMVAAILVTALIPLVSALVIARVTIARVSATAFQPEFGQHIDQALGVYADLARALKQTMRAEAQAIAARELLRAAAMTKDAKGLDAELARALDAHGSLRRIRVETCNGALLAERERPIDAALERSLLVRRAIDAASGDEVICAAERPEEPPVLVATFAAPRARLDELEAAQAFAQAYHQIERVHRKQYLDRTYENAFAVLLALTLVLAVAVGVLVARPVTRRIAALAAAMRPVAEGDLTVRVKLDGDDEVADLGRAFDRMLEELAQSRARVEFLRRMSEWQQVARRLAHEIKNPLTPIQLAVEECHRRYRGDDPVYKRIVQTMLEVVEEEVGSLRRLCTEFSSFARLPRAALEPDDLGVFLRAQSARLRPADGEEGEGDDADPTLLHGLDLTFAIPAEAMPAALDPEMLHRVLANVIRNAAQALRGAGKRPGQVRVAVAIEPERFVVTVDDDGPGIPAAVKEALFDPYVTTKRGGTGLGLSIVKKIIVDHGGTIDAGWSPLGGARFSIVIPRLGSACSLAALERAGAIETDPPSSIDPKSRP
jgi:nitrogen fixation/metabolism regulation signal transduction histidine kinase